MWYSVGVGKRIEEMHMNNFEAVIEKYKGGMPIKEIARELGLSEVKVRRIQNNE